MTYRVATGELFSAAGHFIGECYSGAHGAVNNVAEAGIRNVGPIPPGCVFRIGVPVNHPHLGPMAFPLTLVEGNTQRSGFWIHADNAAHNETASEGCIIASPIIRSRVADLLASGDTELETV